MRGMQLLLTGVLIGGFATFGWVNAQSNQGSDELTGGDLAEIHQLYSHYNQGTDFGDANRWLNAFTEDAIFRIGENTITTGVITPDGRATGKMTACVAAPELRRAPREPGREYHYRHWNSSWIITPDGPDRATGKVYWLAFNPTAETLAISDTGHSTRTSTSGRRTDHPSWRGFKQRHAHPLSRFPPPQPRPRGLTRTPLPSARQKHRDGGAPTAAPPPRPSRSGCRGGLSPPAER